MKPNKLKDEQILLQQYFFFLSKYSYDPMYAVCLQVFVQLNLWHADKIIYAGAKEQISSMRIDISSLDQFF